MTCEYKVGERKEFWVNVYDGFAVDWSSKELADKCAAQESSDRGVADARRGLIRITIEGEDLTVEKVTG